MTDSELAEGLARFEERLGPSGKAQGNSALIEAQVDVDATDYETARNQAIVLAGDAPDASGLDVAFYIDEVH